MNTINTIEEFKEKYSGSDFWFFMFNICTNEVLEYFVNNYTCNFKCFGYIYTLQPITESFIIKYMDNLVGDNIIGLLKNTNINLTYIFIESIMYRFNLYEAHVSIEYNFIAIGNYNGYNIINRLKNNYPHKYQIDKLTYKINKK